MTDTKRQLRYGMSMRNTLSYRPVYGRIQSASYARNGVIVEGETRASAHAIARDGTHEAYGRHDIARAYINDVAGSFPSQTHAFTLEGKDDLIVTLPSQSSVTRLDVTVVPRSHCSLRIVAGNSPKEQGHILIVNIKVAEDAELLFLQDFRSTSCLVDYVCSIGDRSTVHWHELAHKLQGSLSVTNHYLQGQKAAVRTNVLATVQGDATVDQSIFTHHLQEQTTSDLQVRAVVYDRALYLQRGLVHIYPQGDGADGFQKTDILLVDPQAHADALPQLEINNNNVRCSHGATIGHLSDEQLFYLRSRGLSVDDAKETIISGFCAQAIDQIEERLRQRDV